MDDSIWSYVDNLHYGLRLGVAGDYERTGEAASLRSVQGKPVSSWVVKSTQMSIVGIIGPPPPCRPPGPTGSCRPSTQFRRFAGPAAMLLVGRARRRRGTSDGLSVIMRLAGGSAQ